MTRRIILSFLYLIISVSLSANAIDALKEDFATAGYSTYREMSIGGSFSEYASVSFDISGSGFDVEGSEANPPDGSSGLLLGTWTMSANFFPVTVKVNADPMSLSYQTETGTKVAEIPYILRFAYLYPEYNPDGSYVTRYGAFYVLSSVQDPRLSELLLEYAINAGSDFIGSDGYRFDKDNDAPQKINIVNNEIRLVIPSAVRDLVDGYPAGTYTATVTVELVSDI